MLLVITDGDDDASRKSLEYTMKAARAIRTRRFTPLACSATTTASNDKKMVRHSTKELTELARSHRRPGLLSRNSR